MKCYACLILIVKSIRRILFTVLIGCFLICSVFSQNQPLILSGLILDATTRTGIPFVNVTDLKKKATTVTDSTGRFKLVVTEFPTRIVFQQVAYFPDTIVIASNRDFKKNYSREDNFFFLRTNVFMINEVTVRANARKLFEEEPFAILEYQLVKDHIVAMGYRNYNELKKEVMVADMNGKVLWSHPVPKVDELFRDCLGALYIVERDSAHLVYVHADSLLFHSSCGIRYFTEFIRPVHVVTDSLTVFSKTSSGKQYQTCFLIRGKNTEAEQIYQAGNVGKEAGLKAVNQQIKSAFQGVVTTNDVGVLEAMYRMAFAGIRDKQMNYRTVHTDIFQDGDSLLLFDFTAGSIIKFSPRVDKYWKYPIQVAFNKDWVHRLHRDAVTNRYYLEFANGTYSYLIEIDPGTGTEVRKIPIPTYNHVDHIQVNDNRIWFLHQPDFGDRGKKLFYLDF